MHVCGTYAPIEVGRKIFYYPVELFDFDPRVYRI